MSIVWKWIYTHVSGLCHIMGVVEHSVGSVKTFGQWALQDSVVVGLSWPIPP